jgi:hypothetical protein
MAERGGPFFSTTLRGGQGGGRVNQSLTSVKSTDDGFFFCALADRELAGDLLGTSLTFECTWIDPGYDDYLLVRVGVLEILEGDSDHFLVEFIQSRDFSTCQQQESHQSVLRRSWMKEIAWSKFAAAGETVRCTLSYDDSGSPPSISTSGDVGDLDISKGGDAFETLGSFTLKRLGAIAETAPGGETPQSPTVVVASSLPLNCVPYVLVDSGTKVQVTAHWRGSGASIKSAAKA